jgi:hypothetical protein
MLTQALMQNSLEVNARKKRENDELKHSLKAVIVGNEHDANCLFRH